MRLRTSWNSPSAWLRKLWKPSELNVVVSSSLVKLLESNWM